MNDIEHAKKQAKELRRLTSASGLALSTAQLIISRARGYTDWHALHQDEAQKKIPLDAGRIILDIELKSHGIDDRDSAIGFALFPNAGRTFKCIDGLFSHGGWHSFVENTFHAYDPITSLMEIGEYMKIDPDDLLFIDHHRLVHHGSRINVDTSFACSQEKHDHVIGAIPEAWKDEAGCWNIPRKVRIPEKNAIIIAQNYKVSFRLDKSQGVHAQHISPYDPMTVFKAMKGILGSHPRDRRRG